MYGKAATYTNCTSSVRIDMNWNVKHVRAVEPLTLNVEFADGTHGQVIFKTSHLTGVFSVLKDPLFFNQVSAENGFVTWPGELDLAPDSMYREIKANGHWLLA
jgi:Protein of unknown function (DUF2442)